ncbi:MAG: cation-transporting P-type ATPase [Balneolaceae bacterium]|nr:cation-transporting P-type ATPase [Balneolaceae bacterium]
MEEQETKSRRLTKSRSRSREISIGTSIYDVWALPEEEVTHHLNTDPDTGLSLNEVRAREKRWGPNLLRKHKQKSIWVILLEQFRSLIVGLLAAAAGVAFWFGEWVEGWAILVVIAINALIGFFDGAEGCAFYGGAF